MNKIYYMLSPSISIKSVLEAMPLVIVMPYIDQCKIKFKDNNKEHSKDKESAAVLVY